MNRVKLSALFLGALLLASPLAQALPEDSQQPIRVQADSATLDERRNTAIYTGNVIITQGSMTLTGNKVTLFTNADGELERLISQGQPATYRQTPRAGEAPVNARALNIEYRAAEERIILTEKAHLEQQGNTFDGEYIRYDIPQQLVNAGRGAGEGASPTQRIEMTIQPRRRTDNQEQP
ncbi:MAG: lipopolysaccharide transport periplasmic protein LptA [Halopseudomonas yangmingensis]